MALTRPATGRAQGLGSLVGALPGPDGRPILYAAFIAPGLLAAAAMNGAVFDPTFNVFFKLKYNRLYDAADVPVRHHLLPAVGLPRRLQLVVEALPLFHGGRADARPDHGAVHLGLLGYSLVVIADGLVVAGRRLSCS